MMDYNRTQYANRNNSVNYYGDSMGLLDRIGDAVTPDNIVDILSVLGLVAGVVSIGFMGCGYSFAYTNGTSSFYLGPR